MNLFESINFTDNEFNKITSLLDYSNISEKDDIKSLSNFEQFIANNEAPRFIYLIRCKSTNFYKIGKTNNIDVRLRDLQTGCPFELKVIFIAEADMGDFLGREISYLETFLQNNYKVDHKRGEWFELTYEYIADICFFLEESRDLDVIHDDPDELHVYRKRTKQILIDEGEIGEISL
ncbi:MAG: GIY-YIG nuclease family protein [Colwellia sp.]|nr:GIY-YIG nuclease family protein [Colwellia sp.]